MLLCAEMRQAEAVLFGMNVCSHVHTKEMYLQQTVIDGGRSHLYRNNIHNVVHAESIDEGCAALLL